MFFGMLALVAEFERERTRERLADGRGAKRAAGGHIGGSAPFGYRKLGAGRSAHLEPIPEQQDAILTMHRLAAEGASLRAIAGEVRQRHGFVVSHLAVRTALRRPAEGLIILQEVTA
jgi:DNA invertase Pin-like site-specific DNA recombinase